VSGWVGRWVERRRFVDYRPTIAHLYPLVDNTPAIYTIVKEFYARASNYRLIICQSLDLSAQRLSSGRASNDDDVSIHHKVATI